MTIFNWYGRLYMLFMNVSSYLCVSKNVTCYLLFTMYEAIWFLSIWTRIYVSVYTISVLHGYDKLFAWLHVCDFFCIIIMLYFIRNLSALKKTTTLRKF